MGKYIIELPENTHWIQWIMESTKDHHPYMDYKLVEYLTPYTEPDTNEAYQRGYDDAKRECEANIQSNRDEAYNKGMQDLYNAIYTLMVYIELLLYRSENNTSLLYCLFCNGREDTARRSRPSEVIIRIPSSIGL